jgi:hypothetical protein
MEILFNVIWYCTILLGAIAYLLLCVFAVWITDYKEKWKMMLTGIVSLVITPILFLAIWIPVKYIGNK